MGMNISKFNIYRQEQDHLFIYNTLSGGVLHLNKEYAQKFKELQNDLSLVSEFPDLVENLKKGQMLVANTINENEMIITQNNIIRFSGQVYTLTLNLQ